MVVLLWVKKHFGQWKAINDLYTQDPMPKSIRITARMLTAVLQRLHASELDCTSWLLSESTLAANSNRKTNGLAWLAVSARD